MVARASACDPHQLERLVLDELGEGQIEQLSSHLEDCSACRQHLQRLAGDDTWWQETRLFLSGTELSQTEPSISRHDLYFLESVPNSSALGRLGEYDIHGVLGRGGMGIVLKALERPLGRWVAIKVLAAPFASQGVARQRFAREAQAAAAVVHPNVIAIHRVEPQADPPYFVMPLVTGESLQGKIDRQGALELEEVLRIGCQVAEGLAAAHAQGLIHRDIKPANILLDPGTDRVVLTDFGLARAVDDVTLTCTGLIAGTPQYMSPEQARGESLTPQADLFSLGAVLYTMITGRPPFRAESTYGLLRKIADSPARPLRDVQPQTPAWLQVLLDRLLAKQPQQRYAHAEQVAHDLRACLAHVQQPAHCPLPAHLVPARLASPGSRQLVQRLTQVTLLGGLSGWILWQWLAATLTPDSTVTPKPEKTPVESAQNIAPPSPPNATPSPPSPAPIQSMGAGPGVQEDARWQDDLSQPIDELHLRLLQLETDRSF